MPGRRGEGIGVTKRRYGGGAADETSEARQEEDTTLRIEEDTTSRNTEGS